MRSTVQGTCEPRFVEVRDELERNFAERGEVGASVCVQLAGETVVDLWGGVADPATGRAWEADTVNVIMSCSKGAAATCIHLLVERGQVDLDAPVASYWPGFAANGKADITVGQVMSHQAGVIHVRRPLTGGELAEWDLMVDAIAEVAPFWTPGTRHGYHGLALGYIQGEIVRGVTGRSIGTFLADEVAGPLGIDLWMGLPESVEPRVAPSLVPVGDPDAPPPPAVVAAMDEPESAAAALFLNLGRWMELWDTRPFHAAELPAGGAVSNARGLAGLYSPLANGGTVPGGTTLCEPTTVAAMRTTQAAGFDEVLRCHTSYTHGFSKSFHNERLGPDLSVHIGEGAFGAPGAGGQMGFADPDHRLSFGYTMNQHGGGTALNSRGQSLIDAVYRALGSPTRAPGFWVRPG